MAGVLEGVRVLDLTTVLLGPWARADLGETWVPTSSRSKRPRAI